jgi:hypothetical protein
VTSTQEAVGRCDYCGAVVTFTPHADSRWEFDWACARSPHHRGVVSWAHANPPPVWGEAEPMQSGLFDMKEQQ